jgi:hypothetical protein
MTGVSNTSTGRRCKKLTYGGIKNGYDATKHETSSRIYREDLNIPFSLVSEVVVGRGAMYPGLSTSAAGF